MAAPGTLQSGVKWIRFLSCFLGASARTLTSHAKRDAEPVSFEEAGIRYSVAFVAQAEGQDEQQTYLRIEALAGIGWAGFAWGGQMTGNPLAVAWPNPEADGDEAGDAVVISSRWAE